MRHRRHLFVFILILLLAVACAPPLPTAEERAVSTDTPPSGTPTAAATPTPEPQETPVPTLSSDDAVNDAAAEKVIELAKADLAKRLDVPIAEIDVDSVEAVQWRDSSLGCPEEGKMYLQVITPGYRIVLSAGGETYEYHADKSRAVPCDSDEGPSAALPSTEPKEPVIADFDPDLFLFVEVKKERITLSEGQTTSFEGEMIFYTYDQAEKELTSDLNFSVDDALRLVIGREVTVQSGDNRAFSGQLYGYPGELPASLPIQLTKVDGDGQLCFLLDGREHCLEPGDSQSFQLAAKSAQNDSLPIAQKASMTVVNHGFLAKQDLHSTP